MAPPKQEEERAFEPFEQEAPGQRFKRKAAQNPVLTCGLFGGLSVLGYMIYNLKHKPASEKLSVYLIHTRLGVQGTVIGALCLAMGYTLMRDQVEPRFNAMMDSANPSWRK